MQLGAHGAVKEDNRLLFQEVVNQRNYGPGGL